MCTLKEVDSRLQRILENRRFVVWMLEIMNYLDKCDPQSKLGPGGKCIRYTYLNVYVDKSTVLTVRRVLEDALRGIFPSGKELRNTVLVYGAGKNSLLMVLQDLLINRIRGGYHLNFCKIYPDYERLSEEEFVKTVKKYIEKTVREV